MPPSTAKRVLLLGDARQVHLVRWERYLTASGFDVFTASLEPVDGISGASRRIRSSSLLPSFARYPAAVPELKGIIRRFAPDIINAHFLPNYGVMATMTRFHPWVLSTWGSDVMVVPDKTPLHMARTRRVIASADYITSDAKVMTRRLVDLGADPERVVTFPFGVDRSVFHPAEPSDVQGGPRIISNRKLEPVYGVGTVIAAFPTLLKELPDARLTVAADGSQRSLLQAAAARLAASSLIRFAGAVGHADMPGLLREHDIYVSMSLSDTTSVSLLEAMSCGLFPVVSDIPANREWIEPGKNGLLVPAGNDTALAESIAEAWRNRDMRRRARERNEAIVRERADWEQNMSVVGELFKSVLARERT